MALSFVTYGSTLHDLVHRSLHLPHRWNDFLLSVIELLSLRSGTAYRLSHLNHHQHLLDANDIEGLPSTDSLTLSSQAHEYRFDCRQANAGFNNRDGRPREVWPAHPS